MFSQTAEYALRAIVCLAQNQDRSLTTRQISDLTGVPMGYLSKVLQTLTKAELIAAIRGVYGGYVLSISPAELSILRVINVVEPLKRIRHCPLGIAEHGTNLCPLHRKLDQALEITEQAFATTTIDDLLADPSVIKPLHPLSALSTSNSTKKGHNG